MLWQTARGTIDFNRGGLLMGILNVTPDSFSDGGRYLGRDSAIEHGLRLCAEGAAIIDVGGESTRPGAQPVDTDEELRRVVTVIEGLLARAPDCMVSVDTSKAAVARAALEAGAAIVNDVTALSGDPEMGNVVAASGAGVVLMHMRGTPLTMQVKPAYEDVAGEVRASLATSLQRAANAGVAEEHVALDPGIGFGKTREHNFTLLRNIEALRICDRPFVVGVSRKSFLASIAPGGPPDARRWATVALTALLRTRGVGVLRVHDVAENLAALRTAEALLGVD
jgi:dihydropteroate synthase